MKHLYVTTYGDREGFHYPHISRSNCAPAYYLGRPASLWIKAMEPRRRRTAGGHLAGALTGGWERALSAYGGSLADTRVETVCHADALIAAPVPAEPLASEAMARR
jgi:hypothetical protein